MQTPAEIHLIESLKGFLFKQAESNSGVPLLLNIGAGKSTVIEKMLSESNIDFACDRVDIEDVQVSGYNIRNSYKCSAEFMPSVGSGEYAAVFSNYVLEHIMKTEDVAGEIWRVLKPGGIFVASIPNPEAPESLVASATPLWFHRLIRGKEAFETHFAFSNINELRKIFQDKEFEVVDLFYRSCVLSYLERFFLLNKLAFFYDHIINKLKIKRFMNNVCITFRKI